MTRVRGRVRDSSGPGKDPLLEFFFFFVHERNEVDLKSEILCILPSV
jgi:hypothetical protein